MALLCCAPADAQDSAPRVLVPGFRLQRIASSPSIVTPIGVTHDDQGHLLVIESHTHQTPDDYEGPETDRIRKLIDDDGDGVIDRFATFWDGTRHTMSLMAGADGWIYVATRREIFRLRDVDQDGRADKQVSLVQLETEGNYPHNGLAGLTFSPQGDLVFGMGENLGEPYVLIARDGTSIRGGGEGGNVFQCSTAGADLKRLATGFWNPFGNVFDSAGRLFTVDNDPDASPPCRLLHVVESGDYGYQFRFGRSGRHPLQAWDAELPGTLPMAAGTGEAPSQVLVYRGRLWVTSWGDYRLEAYTIEPVGASCQATQQVVVQGDRRFRPVGMAQAPDGSLVVTNWVDRSYPVHGQGNIWRLIPDDATAESYAAVVPARSAAEQRALYLRDTPNWSALDDADPFVRQRAVFGLSQRPDLLAFVKWSELTSPLQRLGLLQALRWRGSEQVQPWLHRALEDQSESVRIYAMRIIAEDRLNQYYKPIQQVIDRWQGKSPQELRVALATLSWLDLHEASRDTAALHIRLASLLNDSDAATSLRRVAIRSLPRDHDTLSTESLRKYFESTPQLRREIIAALFREAPDADEAGQAIPFLTAVARNDSLDVALRADAVAALASYLPASRATLKSLCSDALPSIKLEARRGLRRVTPLLDTEDPIPTEEALSGAGFRAGDAAAGRRVFLRGVGGRCSVCHRHRGWGGDVGPDLTSIDRRGDRGWLLQTILEPNRDVAPRYTSVVIQTRDGRIITGLAQPGPGDDDQETIVQSDGDRIDVRFDDIEKRVLGNGSIMPTGMGQVLSRQELSDLAAFLSSDSSAAERELGH